MSASELFAESNAKAPGRPRWGLISVVVVVLAVVLAAAAVWADTAARAAAEDTVEAELAARLPNGAGPIEARIGGFAFLPQFFAGSLDDLDVTFSLDGQAVPALAGSESSALTIQDGTLTHDGVVDFFGMQVGYTVTLEPTVEGGALVLTPTAVEATSDAASVDLSQLVDLEALTMRACANSLLPASMHLAEVEVVGSALRFHVAGEGVPIDLAQLKERGSCE